MNVADPAGFMLFVIPSVLVSLAFTPILLSISPRAGVRDHQADELPPLLRGLAAGLRRHVPDGRGLSALFGMAAVWGTLAGLSVFEISLFVASIFTGGLLFQYPIGWISDRMDRRR
jgi:hypothetical protein